MSRGNVYVDGVAAARIRPEDGEVLARREFGEELFAGAVGEYGPTYLLGGLAAERPTMIGVDAESLEPLWHFPDAGRYVCHGRYLCAYHPEQQVLHRVRIPDLSENRVSVPFDTRDGISWHCHVGSIWCQFFDHDRFGLDLETGAVIWHQREPTEGHHGYMFATTDTTVYCGKQGVSAYNAATGELMWRQFAGERLACVFELSFDVGWIATESGGVYLLDQVSGDVIAAYDCGERPMGLAPLDRRTIAVATYEKLMVLDFS